jgi:riboflavin transporter 2
VIIIQVANIGPVAYTVLQKFCPIPDNIIIYFLLVIGVIAGFLMAFYYGITAVVLGQERSVVFFSIVFGFALVGCTSSVLFMPYFGRFKDIYLVTYLIGEGFSGLLPGVLGLIQGVGGNAQCIKNENKTKPEDKDFYQYYPPPRFSTETFFIIISSLFVAALIAFTLLDKLKSVREEYAKVTIGHGNKFKYHDHHDDSNSENGQNEQNDTEKIEVTKRVKKLSKFHYRGLLVLLGIVCMFVNAIFPSVMPFGEILNYFYFY